MMCSVLQQRAEAEKAQLQHSEPDSRPLTFNSFSTATLGLWNEGLLHLE